MLVHLSWKICLYLHLPPHCFPEFLWGGGGGGYNPPKVPAVPAPQTAAAPELSTGISSALDS